MSEQYLQLKNIITDTNKLLELAEQGEWDSFIKLEKTRDIAVQTLFNAQPDIQPQKLAEGIKYILEKNKVLVQYSHSQRDSIRMEMSKAGHAHKAIDAYLKA